MTLIFQNNTSTQPLGKEGDLLELKDHSIFEVKGLIHPPNRLIAYPRYILDKKGDRQRGFKRYRKTYPLKERYSLLRQRYPHLLVQDPVFNMELPITSPNDIVTHFRPEEALIRLREDKNLDKVEQRAVDFTKLIEKSSGLESSSLGISGSIMIKIYNDSSDIDIIVCGRKESLTLRDEMKNLLKERKEVRPYSVYELERLYRFRLADAVMSFEDFTKHEKRKTCQGVFKDRDFFIRYLPKLDEVNESYGNKRYIPSGYVKIKAKVKDSKESIFTPCRYMLEQVEVINGAKIQNITEAYSLRGRFCEQAETGENMFIQGKLEKVITSDETHHRLVLGSSPHDYMMSSLS